jgi:hypothetical protein
MVMLGRREWLDNRIAVDEERCQEDLTGSAETFLACVLLPLILHLSPLVAEVYLGGKFFQLVVLF